MTARRVQVRIKHCDWKIDISCSACGDVIHLEGTSLDTFRAACESLPTIRCTKCQATGKGAA